MKRKTGEPPAKSVTHLSGQIRDPRSRICPVKSATRPDTKTDARPAHVHTGPENDAEEKGPA